MKRKFTLLIAALALLTMIVQPGRAWGQTYEKATSISVGDIVVLVTEKTNFARELTGFSSTSTVYGIGGEYTGTPTGAYTFEVVAGNADGSYAFKHDNVYLNWASGNSLNTATSLSNNTSWTVSFSGTDATIKNVNTDARQIWWNVSSPRFACYTGKSDGNQYYITTLYKQADAPTVATPIFTPASGTEFGNEGLEVTIACETTGASIYYTLDGTTPDNTSTPYTAALNLTTTTTVKAIAYDGTNYSNIATATYTYVDPDAPGTANNPYSVAEAITAIDEQGTINEAYVTGIVSQVDSYNSNYNSITYWISDDGTTTDQLEVYSGKGINGADFTSINDIALGAEVVVKGKLKKFGEVYEFDYNNELVSYQAPTVVVAAPTFSPVAGTYATAQNVEINCATANTTIFYTLDGTDPTNASTEYSTAIPVENTTTIKAKAYAGNESSTVATANYYICSQDNPYTVTEALAFSEYQYPANDIFVHGIVSTAPTQDPTSSGQLTYYISADGTATNQLQVYKGKGLNEANFTAQTDIQVGDIVTVYGNVIIYGTTNPIKEFAQGNYLTSFERPEVPAISVEPATINATAAETDGTLQVAYTAIASDRGITWYTDQTAATIADEPDWIIAEINATTLYVDYAIEANDGAARTAYMKVHGKSAANDVIYSNLVTINQSEYIAPTPSISVTPTMVEATAEGTDGTITVTLTAIDNNDIEVHWFEADGTTAATYNHDWIEANVDSNNDIAYVIEENTGDARSAYFKVYGMDSEANDVYSELITINQAAPVTPPTTDNYELFSGALVEGDYIIYYEGSAMKNTVSNNRLSYETVTPENDVIITDDVTIVWHIAQSGDYWTIYSDETEAYAASTGTKNQAQMLSDGTDDKALWSVTGTETYNFVNKYNANASVNAYLRNNVTTQQNYGFACYAEGTGGALSLYKKADNTPSITINPGPYNLNSEGGDAELEVTYSNMPTDPQAVVIFYESNGETPLTENPTWITATINANGNVDGHIDANTGDARSAYFKVKGKDADGNDVYSGLVTVNQAAYTLSIVFETTSLDIEAGGEQNRIISFEYEGLGENPTFTVRTYDASGETQTTYDWLTTSITDVHKVSITVAANTGDARSAYFKVYGENGTINTESNLVTINQAESVQMYTVTFDCDGGTFVPNDDFATVSEQKQAGTYNLPSATKSGWEFAGWNDGETTYEAGAEYTISANMGFTAMWTEITTGIIYFGATSNNSSTPINGESVTGDDNFGNTWTITTVGTTSYTNSNDSGYAQVGSSSKPATSITFTTTLAQETIITAFSAKFGGFSGTAGAVTLNIDNTSVGSGSLSGTSDVVVENTTTATGNVLTVTVTNIAKGVKCYYISYTISTGTDPMIVAQNSIDLSSTDTYGEFDYSIVNPATSVNLTASSTDEWISDINVTAEKVTFVTTQNTSTTDDREGTITLSYTGATDKVVTVTQSKVDFATVPFTYDGNAVSDVPVGLTSNLSGNYGTSPKMKFDATGKYIILKLNEAPKSLSYDIKGQTYSSGTFSVQASVNGSDYENLAVYNSDILNNTIQTFTLVDLSTDVRYIKWIFTEKGTGNIALGNIRALEHYETYGDVTFNDLDLTATSESLIVHTGSVVTITGTLTNTSSDNLIIEDGGQLIVNNSVAATVEKTIQASGSWGSKDGGVDGWDLISSPIGTVNTADVTNLTPAPVGTALQYDLYSYNEASKTWYNQQGTEHQFTQLMVGEGYLYSRKENADLGFAGVVSSASITKALTYTEANGTLAGWNLVGNPYTHNITWANLEPTNVVTTGYYTLGYDGQWSAEPSTTTVIKPMQGFLVKANDSGAKIIFNNTASKSRANDDYIKFIVANSQYEDAAYAMFSENEGLDKINHRNADIPMVYIPQNGQNYAIATMDDNTQVFELNFKAMTTGQYTLSYKAEGKYSYLHVIDRLTGEDIDMLLDGEYSFIGSPRDNEARFIVKLNYNANIDEIEVNDNFAYQNGSDIIVNGNGELQVFDVTGRMVMNTKINGIQTVNVPATGMYIFRMVGESVQTQKIVVR